MADVKVSTMTWPYPLGKILPGGTTASVPLTQNVTPVNEDGSAVEYFSTIRVYAHPDNTKSLFICTTAAAPDTTNYTNVIGFIKPGEAFVWSKEWANNRRLGSIFIGAADADDFAVGSIEPF